MRCIRNVAPRVSALSGFEQHVPSLDFIWFWMPTEHPGQRNWSNVVDLLNPPAEVEKRKYKLKRLVQSPNSFFFFMVIHKLCDLSSTIEMKKINGGYEVEEDGVDSNLVQIGFRPVLFHFLSFFVYICCVIGLPGCSVDLKPNTSNLAQSIIRGTGAQKKTAETNMLTQDSKKPLSVGMIIQAHMTCASLETSVLMRPWFIILVLARAGESLSGLAQGVAVERDWVVLWRHPWDPNATTFSKKLTMSTHEQQTSTIPTSVVRNTGGKSGLQNLEEPASNEALRELCDKNYHQILPLIAEKMQKEKEQQDKLKASREGGMGASTLESHHQSPVSSEDSNKTDLLHLGSGRGRREVCSIGGEEKNLTHLHALIVTTRVPKQRELRYRQESIITRAHRPEEPADIRRAKTAKGVTGSPNKKGIGQIPAKMISPSLGCVKKETLSRLGSDILTSQGQGCLAMSRLMMEVGIRKTI
ncbi:reverse transcriptase domain-containing protein [Tanacetum coccineum]